MALTAPAISIPQFDAQNSQHPSSLRVLKNQMLSFSKEDAFYFGYVLDGECELVREGLQCCLKEEMFFSVNPPFSLKAGGTVVLMKRNGYKGLNAVGGPVEKEGRQRYIDNCTSTLLLSPAMLGDCCLNFLHFPPNTNQSRHFHPSIRLGVVIRGEGICHLDEGDINLSKGVCFLLNENERHSFSSGVQGLDVIAYHPDSDWGPTHEVHPMLNRTFLTSFLKKVRYGS